MKKYLLLSCLLLTTVISLAQTKTENLKIVWPEEYKWKIGSNQEDGGQHLMELIPGNETIEKWTIIGTMLSVKGATNVSMDMAMNLMFEQANQMAVKPTLTLIERNDTATHPWIIFKIEAAAFKNDSKPESQLYYMLRGETSLYSNFVAIKETTLSKEFVTRWTAVFKNSELVYQ